MNNEFIDTLTNLIGDITNAFTGDLKEKIFSMLPDKDTVITYLIIGIILIICISKIFKTSIGAVLKIGVAIGALAFLAGLI